MSFLRKGARRRGKVAAALTTVGALAAFQALALVGAGAAFAAGTCSYDLVTDTVEVELDANTGSDLQVDGTTGAIEFDDVPCDTATNSNTVAIVVQGQNGSDETIDIDEDQDVPFSTTIAWEIDLGSGTGDQLDISLEDQDNTLVVTNTSFNLNGALGVLSGVEEFDLNGDNGDDTIDGSATSNFMDVSGSNGDDVISPGTFDGDNIFGEGGVDTLSYATRTTCTAVVNDLDAGLDANCDGDNDDAGDEEDNVGDCFQVIVTGSGNDFIDDDGCGGTTFAPGAGDDDIVNDLNPGDDTLDLSSSTGPVTIDAANRTATGQGTDTWEDLDEFIGSEFDDTLLTEDDAPGFTGVFRFSGLGGVDTVDASGATSGVDIDLDSLDPDQDDLENAIGGPGNDSLNGNDLRNVLTGNAGDDFLNGRNGNDTLIGGTGNDEFDPDAGADTVSFATNTTAGVNVDLSLGFATSSDSGDDSFSGGDLAEIIVGSNFNDQITGGPFGGGGTINFLFKGKAGRDVLTGFNGNDTLNGGKGRDTLRGVGGDDTLLGKKGADTLAGGSGFDVGKGGPGNDTCRGVERRSSC
jgi:RTX calcium-binding nonapeptide repeat (4 copies)